MSPRARLACVLGHEYTGSVRVVQVPRFDMDGEPLRPETLHEFDPPKCILCGLATWKAVEAAEFTVDQLAALRQYLSAHREDISASINDFATLGPLLAWLDESQKPQ